LPEHRAFADVKATIDVLHYLNERTSILGVAGIEDFFRVPSVQKRSRFLKKSLSHEAPSSPGVYIFISDDNTPLYIGTSKNIRNRLRSYFTSDDRLLISKMLETLIKNAEKCLFPKSRPHLIYTNRLLVQPK
jgi:DNA polymerase-3 subunit epsilon